MKLRIPAILLALFSTAPSFASHYLPKQGDKPINVRIGTCAITGGFVHLYAGQDYGIFEKYGLKTETIFIRGSGPALAHCGEPSNVVVPTISFSEKRVMGMALADR